jgi:hypothetical protein
MSNCDSLNCRKALIYLSQNDNFLVVMDYGGLASKKQVEEGIKAWFG